MSGEIILGYDGSEGSKAALKEAVGLAGALGAPIVLAFGDEPPAAYAGEPGRQRDAIADIGTKALQEGLDAAAKLDPSVAVSAQTIDGRPAEALAALATQLDAHMIVVGHHGGSALRGAIMGSVTFKVLHDAPCPVLVVTADG